MLSKKRRQKNKIQHKGWGDLKNDKAQQNVYKENINFVADLYKKYAER